MNDELIKQSTQAIGVFLKYYNIRNDQGLPLDFNDHAYLKQIYQDFTPKQAVLKAAQVGFSTTANIKAFWLAKYRRMDIIYSLPSASDIKSFVSGKTNRLIDNNPIFQEWVEDKDSIEQKRVGGNVIYFKGTWTERAAIATPADLYISDETDRSKQEIVQQFKTRLQHSKYGWEWYFSNPSAPGMGVDLYWQQSDQKHWFVKCECGYEWYLTMDNIMGTPPYFGCVKCRKELDRRKGRWVAKSDKEISGYWIPSFCNPNLSAQYILDKKKDMSEQQFTNFVLGTPFVGKGNVLTKSMFLQNLTDEVNPQDCRPIIGVDTGMDINYVIANKYGTFFYDKCSNYAPLKELMRKYKNAIMIIDYNGDYSGPKELKEEFSGRVFSCFFHEDRKNDKLIDWDDSDHTVRADRNKLMQLVVEDFANKRMPVYGTEAEWYDYWLEWAGMYRTTEINSLGINTFKWNKPATGRCDFPFCSVYARIGLDRFREDRATFHESSNNSFAFQGLDVRPNDTARL